MKNKLSMLAIAWVVSPIIVNAEQEQQRGISVAAELSKPEVIARYEKQAQPKLLCAQPSSPAAQLESYQSLSSHKWSRKELGCAAQYGYELAMAPPLNPELAMGALVTQIDYLDLLASEYEGLYAGPELSAELRLRWERARKQGGELVALMEPAIGPSIEFRLLRATFWLAASTKETTPEQASATAAKAMPELEAVIAERPDALGGLALMLLGRMTFILPEFSGGDPLRAIELFKQGIAINPQDMVMRRWLTEVLVSERDYPAALGVIEEALKAPINPSEPQAYADELRALSGLARRAGNEELSLRIATLRQAHLKANPQLLARRSTASFGHGGADPFTGKEDE